MSQRRADSLEKTLILGKIEGRRRRGRQRMRGFWMASPTQWTWVWVNSRSWWWTGRPGILQSLGSQRVRQGWMSEVNWTQPLEDTAVPCSVAWPSLRVLAHYWSLFLPSQWGQKEEGLPLRLLFNLGRRPTHSDHDFHYPLQSSHIIKQ